LEILEVFIGAMGQLALAILVTRILSGIQSKGESPVALTQCCPQRR
jgi:hypothetical protein